MAGAGLVVLLAWRRGAALAENRRLLERAAAEGRVRPRGWRAAAARWRSIAVRADGTIELGTRGVRTAARRLGLAGVTGRIGERG